MCNCFKHITSLLESCRHNDHSSRVLYINDSNTKIKCFALSLVLYINANPIAFSVLPRKILINNEPLLVEYGGVSGKLFHITPSLQVFDE
uniref:Nonstructural protein n=1 Tax=Bird deltacoronavirus CalidrisCN24 TaxID=3237949 RepID=A0AB39AFX2_9NIDO